jgi:integrase
VTISKRTWKHNGKARSAWQIHVQETAPSGEIVEVRRNATLNDKESARKEEIEIRAQIVRGTYQGPTTARPDKKAPPAMPTIEEFAEVCREHWRHHTRESTQGFYALNLRVHILPLLGHIRLDQVTAGTVADLLNACLAKQHQPRTANGILRTFSVMLNLAVEREVIPKAPKVKKLRPTESEPKFLSFEDADRLVSLVRETEPEWTPLTIVALKTGLRIGELIALRWSDVDPGRQAAARAALRL